jgi:major intracellular serine protease
MSDQLVDPTTVRIILCLWRTDNVAILYKAIKAAVDKGISVVCAAGNNGDANHSTNEYAYPGAYGIVIEVGASDKLDQVASFSNTNNRIDVVAPGVDVLSTMPNGLWARMSGTSMATPHVAGALALIISAHEAQGQKLTEMEAYELLLKHVRPLPYAKNAVGHGIVDLIGLEVKEIKPEPMPELKSIPVASVFAKENKHFVNVGPFDTKEQADEMFKSVENLLKNNS